MEVRYQHSFRDFITDRNPLLYSEIASGYHRNWMVNVGYLLPW